MTRKYDPVDLMVVVGLCAIIASGYLVFMAADGLLQAATATPSSSEEVSADPTGNSWLQPTLGQAILDTHLLEREAPQAITAAVAELNRATLVHQSLQDPSLSPLGVVLTTAPQIATEHMGRVQAVMGRSIVNFTRRGVGVGLLSPASYTSSSYNTRLIRLSEAMGRRLETQFAKTWQENLGQAIVQASSEQEKLALQTQEKIGNAVIHVTQAQAAYEEAQGLKQEQLASSIVAAIRSVGNLGSSASRIAQGAKPGGEVVVASNSAAWLEIPFGYLVVALAGLIGVFCGGIMLPTPREEEPVEQKAEAPELVYRKTA